MGKEASIIGISRHRLGSDGHGVTTLVAFHGSLLRCKYCRDNQYWKSEGISRKLTASEFYDEVPLLAFDYDMILRMALQELRRQIYFEPSGFELLPEKFTMREQQNLYEAIIGVRFVCMEEELPVWHTATSVQYGDKESVCKIRAMPFQPCKEASRKEYCQDDIAKKKTTNWLFKESICNMV